MFNEFERSGVSLRYPANWRLEADGSDDPDAWTISIHSPETAFLLVSLRPDASDPAQLADQALGALREEYEELDAENRVETLAGQAAIGHDIDFLTVDTATSCRTRCLQTASGPLLLMSQTSEYDRDRHEPVLLAIMASVQVEDWD
jgi:hypothetical protein